MGDREFRNLRGDFPALEQSVYGRPLVYLDTAATALKPKSVIETLHDFYQRETANVHRGAHFLSHSATEKFEQSRVHVKKFIGAADEREIVFTRGTTDSINLVAQTFGRQNLKAGDEIILTEMEHHSNIVPWQILAEELALKIRWVPVDEAGELIVSEYKKLLNEKTKLVSLTHCSNAIGTVNPVQELTRMAHSAGAKVLVDAAQSVTFLPIDVQDLDCDFLAFSGHKLYGPFGVGVLYGKLDLLESLKPPHGGGGMIHLVTKERSTFLGSPQKFEAGTPHIAGVIGLGAAIDYVQSLGREAIGSREKLILNEAVKKLGSVKGLKFIGTSTTRTNIVSFIIEGLHASDIGQILDQQGVAIRTGHHCAQILMNRFSIPGTVRASFGVYNCTEDVDILVQALEKAKEMLT